jgi:hypothetical protein
MGTELPTKVMMGQTLVLMQMIFLNNLRKVGRLVLSRTSCLILRLAHELSCILFFGCKLTLLKYNITTQDLWNWKYVQQESTLYEFFPELLAYLKKGK